jgi:toxin ParE1/3/4
VAKYRLSRRAESDLLSIGSYTLESWGEAQFSRYLEKLESCCQAVAENPNLGRPCTHIRPGLRRINEGKHVIFYRQEPGGILICRILHERILPERHPFDEEGD